MMSTLSVIVVSSCLLVSWGEFDSDMSVETNDVSATRGLAAKNFNTDLLVHSSFNRYLLAAPVASVLQHFSLQTYGTYARVYAI